MLKKKFPILIAAVVCLLLSPTLVTAQKSKGGMEVDFVKGGFGDSKLRSHSKKIFIDEFKVIYQLMYVDEENQEGGRMVGGGYRGDVKVSLALGLKGPVENDFVQVTDEAYSTFVNKLKSAGFEIITADQAAGIEEYSGWERKKGGQFNEAQFKGFATLSPSGFEYFVRKTQKGGKEKTTFIDNGNKVSKQLGNAIVMSVNLVVPFAEESESQGSKALGKLAGGLAKVVATTRLRLSSELLLAQGFSSDHGLTSILARHSEKGLPGSSYTLKLEKDYNIDGVVEKKTYKVVETADRDVWGQNAGLFTIFNPDDRFLKNLQPVEVEAAAYRSAVLSATTQFIESSLDKYISLTKK